MCIRDRPNSSIVDFQSIEQSINLFVNSTDNVVVASELLMSLLSSYMSDLYNSTLERVLPVSYTHLMCIRDSP